MPKVAFFKPLAAAAVFALLFSAPIWCGAIFLHFHQESFWIFINTLLAPTALISFLKVPSKVRFLFGFLAGLILFHWIGFSFRFSPFPLLLGVVMVAVALIYGLIFWLILWKEHIIFRAVALILLSFIHPFSFDWLQVQAFFAYSLFGVDGLSFVCLIASCVALCGFYHLWRAKAPLQDLEKFYKNLFKTAPAALACACVFFTIALGYRDFSPSQLPSDFPKIAIAQTHTSQNLLWDEDLYAKQESKIFKLIEEAKALGADAIILPESAIPTALNLTPDTLHSLLSKSSEIAIILGSLRAQNLHETQQTFNSTYVFQNRHLQIIDKVILAPFGERIPLPDFLAKPLYRLFFDMDSGIHSAKEVQDFQLFHTSFRNAICYEGTSAKLYEGSPPFVIMTSNNAWFIPSLEPYFQQILLKFYSRLHHSIILHSANASRSMVISPALFSPPYQKHIFIILDKGIS